MIRDRLRSLGDLWVFLALMATIFGAILAGNLGGTPLAAYSGIIKTGSIAGILVSFATAFIALLWPPLTRLSRRIASNALAIFGTLGLVMWGVWIGLEQRLDVKLVGLASGMTLLGMGYALGTAVSKRRTLWSERALAAQFPYSLVDDLSPDQIVFPAASDGREIRVDYATCGGVPMRAIWAHPPVHGDTVIRYRVKTSPGTRYLLLFNIGIRDGARMSPGNQVEFTVRVDGGEVFRERISATQWQSRLPRPGRPFVASGELMTIELVTNALGNNAYNWAVWGEPILVEALRDQG